MNAKIGVKLLVFTLIQFNSIQLFNTVNNLTGAVWTPEQSKLFQKVEFDRPSERSPE